jgi:O-antigen/teichoic acid export membrane protein
MVPSAPLRGAEGQSVGRDRIVYKTVLSLATIATSGLIRLVFSVLIARVFGAGNLGHANFVVSAAVFATLLCSPGAGQAVARNLATRGLDGRSGDGRSMLAWATGAHHALCVVLAAAVAMLVPATGWGDRGLAFGLTVGYGCYTYYKAVLYGVDRVERYAVMELAWDGMFVLALAVVVLTQADRWVLAPMVVVYLGFAITAHLSLFPSRGSAPAGQRPGAVERRRLISYAGVTAIGTVSSAGFLQLSQIFAHRVDAGPGAGLFAAAMTLVTPAYLLPRAISVVLFPAMARAAGRADRESVRRQLTMGTDLLAGALLPAFVFVGMVATALLTVIYGGVFAAAGPTLVIMVWATWVSIASVPAVNALSSDTGRGYWIPATASVAGFVLGLALWLCAGTSIQLVAWGYLVGSVIQSAVPLAASWRRLGDPRPGMVFRVTLTAAAALVGGLLVVHSSTSVQVMVGVLAAGVAALAVFPELRSLARGRREHAVD